MVFVDGSAGVGFELRSRCYSGLCVSFEFAFVAILVYYGYGCEDGDWDSFLCFLLSLEGDSGVEDSRRHEITNHTGALYGLQSIWREGNGIKI